MDALQATIGESYPSQRLKSQIVSFYSLNVVIPSKPPVAVHDKRDMLGNWALLKGPDEQFA